MFFSTVRSAGVCYGSYFVSSATLFDLFACSKESKILNMLKTKKQLLHIFRSVNIVLILLEENGYNLTLEAETPSAQKCSFVLKNGYVTA